jgi:hypothetical protein
MLKLAFASLVALSSSATVAHADRPEPVSPAIQRMPRCTVTADAPSSLFMIHRDSTMIADYTSTTLSVFTNGAWTYTELKGGKIMRADGGCLDAQQLKTIREALAPATWKTSIEQFRCAAAAMDFTEYSYNGKHVLKTELCDGLILDGKTSKALAAATAITSQLGKPTR